MPVLELEWGTETGNAVAALLKVKRSVTADEHFTYAAPPDVPTPPEFASALTALLRDAGAQVKQVEVSRVRAAAAEDPWVLLEALSQPMQAHLARGSAFARNTPPVLCFNLGHPAIDKASRLFTTAPRLAAVLMARLVLVQASKLDAQRDAALTRWALS